MIRNPFQDTGVRLTLHQPSRVFSVVRSGNDASGEDEFEQEVQTKLISAHRLSRKGALNSALQQVDTVIEDINKKLPSSISVLDQSQVPRLQALQSIFDQACLMKEEISFELDSKATILAKCFELHGLESDDFLHLRSKAFRMLELEEGFIPQMLDKAKDFARVIEQTKIEEKRDLDECLTIKDDEVDQKARELVDNRKRRIRSLLEKGIKSDVQELKGKSIKTWVEEIGHQLSNPSEESLSDPEIASSHGKINGVNGTDRVDSTSSGKELLSSASVNQTKAGSVPTVEDEEDKIVLSDLSITDLVNSSSPEVGILTGKLINDNILNSENEDELKLIILLANDSKVSNKIKKKDYTSFDEPERIKTVFDEVGGVIAGQQIPGLRIRVVELFKDKQKSDSVSEVSAGIRNFADAFGIDPKVVELYSVIESLDKKPNPEDILLAEGELVLSLKNEKGSLLLQADTPADFVKGYIKEINSIDVELKHLKLSKEDLYAAKCFWLIRNGSDSVKAEELLELVNRTLSAEGAEQISIKQLIGSLDKLNVLCTEDKKLNIPGSKVRGISGDVFVLDITSGIKSETDKSIIKAYRRIILREPVCTYEEFLRNMKEKLQNKEDVLEEIMDRKLRLSPIDFCILTAGKLFSQEGNEKDFRVLLNEVLTANNIKYELGSEEELQRDVGRRIEKINSIFDSGAGPIIRIQGKN